MTTYRPAVVDDASCIAVLGLQVFLDTYAPAGIRATLAREVLDQFALARITALLVAPDQRCVVAKEADHLIGFAQLQLDTPDPRVPPERPAKLDRLYVQEPFTGRGIGAALLARAESTAAAAGARTLWLTTWIGNARALAFYPRRGYADVGATVYAFEHERHENRVFAKTL